MIGSPGVVTSSPCPWTCSIQPWEKNAVIKKNLFMVRFGIWWTWLSRTSAIRAQGQEQLGCKRDGNLQDHVRLCGPVASTLKSNNDMAQKEIWLRSYAISGNSGTGTQSDPFDASTADLFDTLMRGFRDERTCSKQARHAASSGSAARNSRTFSDSLASQTTLCSLPSLGKCRD